MTDVRACLCGGAIAAPSLELSGPAVLAHNRTVLHRIWRMLDADPQWLHPDLLAERLPAGTYGYPRRPTAGRKPVDMLQGDVGASGAEGTT